jgi:hypothetical protein
VAGDRSYELADAGVVECVCACDDHVTDAVGAAPGAGEFGVRHRAIRPAHREPRTPPERAQKVIDELIFAVAGRRLQADGQTSGSHAFGCDFGARRFAAGIVDDEDVTRHGGGLRAG